MAPKAIDNADTPVFRFAPSPNGYLHLGHALSALLNFEMARAAGGRLLLRIEDIDATRCRPEFEAAIYEDLAWLGIAWEAAGAAPVRASRRLPRRCSTSWSAAGLVYPSFESRAEIAAPGRRARTHGTLAARSRRRAALSGQRARVAAAERAARIATGDAYALRLDTATAMWARTGDSAWIETGAGPGGETGRVAAAPEAWGDVILARKETPTSYHLAVVVDDALQGVTHVVRGQDLFWSTSVHRLLQALLGLPEPVYHHHRLILDADGRKLVEIDQRDGAARIARAGQATGRETSVPWSEFWIGQARRRETSRTLSAGGFQGGGSHPRARREGRPIRGRVGKGGGGGRIRGRISRITSSRMTAPIVALRMCPTVPAIR